MNAPSEERPELLHHNPCESCRAGLHELCARGDCTCSCTKKFGIALGALMTLLLDIEGDDASKKEREKTIRNCRSLLGELSALADDHDIEAAMATSLVLTEVSSPAVLVERALRSAVARLSEKEVIDEEEE